MFQPHLEGIDRQRDAMIARVIEWSKINSGTSNLPGLARMCDELEKAFETLGGTSGRIGLPPATTIDSRGEEVETPLGEAMVISKRADAPLRVLLNIHYDTVYDEQHAFQVPRRADDDTLVGPGVADAKGGIVVMLAGLEALERSPWAQSIGWEVILNPDEEIGSPGSAALLAQAAARNQLGLVFEPAFSDGAIVDSRKGAGTFTVVFRGRAAHAGREFAAGRSAVLALVDFISTLDVAAARHPGIIINAGRIEGGNAVNIVPELAIARINVRATTPDDQRVIESLMQQTAEHTRRRDGIRVNIHGRFASPPKMLDDRSRKLLDHILRCGRELGMNLAHRPSGGVSDGNKLAAAGLAVIDSLGPIGGDLHSDREFLKLSSLTQRAKLTALLLMKLASGAISVP